MLGPDHWMSILGQPVHKANYHSRTEELTLSVLEGHTYQRQRVLGIDATFALRVISWDVVTELQNLLYRRACTLRHIGPSATCPFCGTAWLPGTLQCPNCAGATHYQPLAIAYEGSGGLVTDLNMSMAIADVAVVELQMFYPPETPLLRDGVIAIAGDERPEAWLCGFCGLYVSGYTSKCPGCAGNRVPLTALADLRRVCIYCGRATVGGYACPQCNGRLAGWRAAANCVQ